MRRNSMPQRWDDTHLVFHELGGVLEIHFLLLHGVVDGGERQAAQCVAACNTTAAVVPRHSTAHSQIALLPYKTPCRDVRNLPLHNILYYTKYIKILYGNDCKITVNVHGWS